MSLQTSWKKKNHKILSIKCFIKNSPNQFCQNSGVLGWSDLINGDLITHQLSINSDWNVAKSFTNEPCPHHTGQRSTEIAFTGFEWRDFTSLRFLFKCCQSQMHSQTSVLCFNVKQLSSIVSSAFQVSRFVCAQKTVALCRQVSPRGRTNFF